MSFSYHFEWDTAKAISNLKKHGISFESATSVFNDPFMLSIIDEEHSEAEDRWLTLGLTTNSKTLVVIHTYHEAIDNDVNVRIISARSASKKEQKQYEANT
jgi:uncharacterized DUF497 family protein